MPVSRPALMKTLLTRNKLIAMGIGAAALALGGLPAFLAVIVYALPCYFLWVIATHKPEPPKPLTPEQKKAKRDFDFIQANNRLREREYAKILDELEKYRR